MKKKVRNTREKEEGEKSGRKRSRKGGKRWKRD